MGLRLKKFILLCAGIAILLIVSIGVFRTFDLRRDRQDDLKKEEVKVSDEDPNDKAKVDQEFASRVSDKNKNASSLNEEDSIGDESNELSELKGKNEVDLSSGSCDDLTDKDEQESVSEKENNTSTESEKDIESGGGSDFELSDNSGGNDEQEVNTENDDPKESDAERNIGPEGEDIKNEEHEEASKSEKEIDGETSPEQDFEAEERKARLETTNPLLYVEDVTTTSDSEKILVSLKIKNNPGVLGMLVSVYFDEKAVCLSKVKNGDAVDGVLSLTAAKVLKSGCNFVWDGQSLGENDISDGALMEMEFNLVPGVPTGKYPIKIICESDDAVDADLQPINFEIVDGFIKIK